MMLRIILLLVGLWHTGRGQMPLMPDIERMLDAGKNDSALVALQPFLEKNQGNYTYYRALLNEGIALCQSGKSTEAIRRFHEIQKSLAKDKYPDLIARTDLRLALLHENASAEEHNRQYLLRAENRIKKYDLDTLRPELLIRKASFLRIYEDKASMIPYLKQVLEIAPRYKKYKEMAEAHLLFETLTPLDEWEKKIFHLNEGIHFYKLAGNLPGAAAMYFLKGRAYDRKGQSALAHLMLDSSIHYAMRIPEEERLEYLAHPYGLKAHILEGEGKIEASMSYLKQSFSNHYEVTSRRLSSKVAEVEARHQLERQEYEFKMATRLKNGVLWIGGTGFFIALVLIGVIFRYARRIKLANIHLENQTATIQEQAARLQHVMDTKTQFFANVSHELRTPLTLMLGPLDSLIREGKWTDKQLRLLETVRQGGNNLEFLVQQILDLGKLDSGQVLLQLEEVAAKSYFENLLAQFESFVESKGILYLWTVRLPENEIWLLDREKMRQIAYNLLGNAFKFTPAGGQISAEVTSGKEHFQFLVTDTGIGIADHTQVFERYYQEDGREGGLGLGLGICKEYTEMMGGKVDVQSKAGAGSAFRVTLPLRISELAVSRAHGKPQHAHLLLVEDNRQVRDYLSYLLQEHYQVSTAENGERALAFLEDTSAVDIILTDLSMPTMNGMDLVSILKSKPETRGIPVIMLTAKETEDTRLNALRVGVDDYIQKPFREEELLVRIQNLLNNYAQRKGQGAEVLPSADQLWLEEFESFIAQHLGDSELNIPQVGDAFSMSESTLLRTLKRLTGLSPHQYIQEMRLKQAYQALKGKKFNSVQEVAFHSGYKDTKTFSRAFKNRFGILPSAVD